MNDVIPRLACALLPLACACQARPPETCDSELPRAPAYGDGGNVLIVILDDVGVDQVSGYGMHPDPTPTPVLDALAASGVRFDRAYASSSCSPSRASLLTGRHPSRTGMGRWLRAGPNAFSLPQAEITVAEMLELAPQRWSTALVGKWHLSALDPERAPWEDPLRQGFDRFVGVLGNLDSAALHRQRDHGATLGYFLWERVDGDEVALSKEWITRAQTDDALMVLQELSEPWLQIVSYSAAHAPWVHPPDRPYLLDSAYRATLRNLDSELGRLLSAIDLDTTTVIVLSDNGTPASEIEPPWVPQHGKHSLFEAGVRVPLVVAGRAVTAPGTVSTALVSITDVFATVADLAGVDLDTLRPPAPAVQLPVPIDGHSLRPWLEGEPQGGRRCLLVEHFHRNGDPTPATRERAVLDQQFKLLDGKKGEQLYALGSNPGEEVPLEDEGVEERLREELRRYERALR